MGGTGYAALIPKPSPALGAKHLLLLPKSPAICPAQLQAQLRDAEVPAGEQVTMAVWQHSLSPVMAHEFALQNPLLAWKNHSSFSFLLVCLCGH